MLTDHQTIATPTHSNQILFQGELKALWVMSSKGKRCSISRAGLLTNAKSLQHLKSESPALPPWYWLAMLSSHLHYTSKAIFLRKEKASLPHIS